MLKHLLTACALALPLLARAHEGHGLIGLSHWHADDALLFLGAAVAATVWYLQRKR